MPTSPAPGFYADPQVPGRERYWDGQNWTHEWRASGLPSGSYSSRVGAWGDQDEVGGIVIAGYICAVLIPIVGVILGYIATGRRSRATSQHGPRIIVLSVLVFVGFLLFGGAILNSIGGGGSGGVTVYTVTSP